MVAVAYRRRSFNGGSNCEALTGKILMFFDFDVMKVRLYSHYFIISLQWRRFLRAHECFARDSAMLKLEKNGENGASQKERGRGRGERFFSPLPLPSFLLSPSLLPLGLLFLLSLIFLRHKMAVATVRTFARTKISLHCRLVYHFNKTSVTSQTTEATETIPPKLLSNIVYNLQIFHRAHHS